MRWDSSTRAAVADFIRSKEGSGREAFVEIYPKP